MRAFFLLILLLPLSSLAQVSISGKVIDHSDKGPIPNASVFLTNATIGEQSAPDGTFRLNNIKPGKYELVISMIGFEIYRQNVVVEDANIVLPDIEIKAKINALKEVKITVDPNRDRYLEWFTDEFIGASEIARQCKIVNPEVLSFSYDREKGILTASSDGFLTIQNNALGYTLSYIVTNFTLNNKDIYNKEIHYDGSVFFKEMTGKRSQMADWEAKRQEVYKNSAMHFFRALLANNMDQEGFRVYQISVKPNLQRPDQRVIDAELNYYQNAAATVPHKKDSLAYWIKKSKMPKSFPTLMHYPLGKEDIVKRADSSGLYFFTCDNDGLYVTYSKNQHFRVYNSVHLEPGDTDVTIINFREPAALLDANGGVTNPNSLVFDGVWAHKRVSDLLPLNYEPTNNEDKPDSVVTKNIVTKLTNYFTTHITEKAYLHFDKPYYAAGDTVYFKAYVTQSESHQLSQLSNVLHVDLVNPKSHIDQSIKLRLANGLAWGEFTLPDSLPNGNYVIRAYTRLMRNNQEAGYFDKVIPVTAVRKNIVVANKPVQNTNSKIDIQFFPEGGDLLSGIRSKVAFKAIGANGLGVNAKGKIMDSDNNEVGSFVSQHLGMGYFYLEPHENKTYRAEVVYADGTGDSFNLPNVQNRGITLSATTDLPNQTQVTISASKTYYSENKGRDFTLLVYSGGEVMSYAVKLKDAIISVDIQTRQLNSGVARLTLFSQNSELLSERLLFIRKPDLLSLQITSDKSAYAKREKVKISLNATQNGRPAGGHFSVTVVDDSQIPVDDNSEHTILTDLLLTSELKGYIEKPNYYFTSDSREVNDNLDLLMLTQGYRRFEWKQVINSKADQVLAYQAERSLELEGMIKSTTGKPVPDEDMILIDNKDNLLLDTITDKSGLFKFTDLFVTDTPLMILQAKRNNKPQNVVIAVKRPDILPLVSRNITTNDTVPQKVAYLMEKKFAENANGGIKLKQVRIIGYKPKPKPDLSHSANLNGPGNANYVIMGDELVGCTDITCLFGKIPGMTSKIGNIYLVRTGARLGQKTPKLIPPPPSVKIFIDGVPYDQDENPFDFISMKDIYSIEALTSASYLALYGTNAAGGALIVTTRRGRRAPVHNADADAPGLVRFPFTGFYKSREFYSPKYDHAQGDINHKDLRTTVYWKPELIADKDGNASFEYYNADGHGTCRVIVEGIDERGNIGRQLYSYKME